MDLIECISCKKNYNVTDEQLHVCECGQGLGKAKCTGCLQDITIQFDLFTCYRTEVLCKSCNDTQFLTPCINCSLLNLRRKNTTYLKCGRCNSISNISTCPSCQMTLAFSTPQTIIHDCIQIECVLGCQPYTIIKCSECKFNNEITNFVNQGEFKCQKCKNNFYKIYCSSCKTIKSCESKFVKLAKTKSTKCPNAKCKQQLEMNKQPKNITTYQNMIPEPKEIQAITIKQSSKQYESDLLDVDIVNVVHNNEQQCEYQEQEIENTNFDCQQCHKSNSVCILYPCGHKNICVDCSDNLNTCEICGEVIQNRIVNVLRRNLDQEIVDYIRAQNQLYTIQELHQKGYYRKAYEEIDKLAHQLKQLDPQFQLFVIQKSTIPFISEFYSEYAQIALKMSLLDIAKKSVECCYYYLKDNQNIDILINNTLTYQRINFWLCKYTDSIIILKQLILHLKDQQKYSQSFIEIYIQMANALRAWCSFTEAEECIMIAEQLLKTQNVNMLISSNVLFVKARLYMDTDRSKQGIDLAQECLDQRMIHFKNINEEHPEIAIAQELVAKIYFSLNNITQAQLLHEQAYHLKIKIFGLYNFETMDSINERGRLQLSLKKEKEAMNNFQQIGDISQLLLDPCNQYQALSHNNLGCALYNQTKFEESIQQHSKALKIYEVLCGKNHQKLFFSLNQMACANKNLNRHKIAISLWQRCLDILENNNKQLNQKQINNVKQSMQQINLTILED